MKRTHWTLAALLAALASGSTIAHAATAAPTNGGSFRMDKNKTNFSAGCGFRVPAPEDGVGKVKRVVVLASLKMDCAAADQGFDPVAALETTLRDASADYAVLNIGADGDRIDGNWTSADPSDGFSFGGQGKVEMVKNDDRRVEGRYRTEKPDSFFDKTYEFDFRFAVDLLGGSLEGTALPAGGGDPGKAYLAYVKALQKPDIKALKSLTTADNQGSFDLWEDKDFLKLARSMELKEAKVTSGLQKGSIAALEVTGKNFDGDAMGGRIYLRQEGGAWKVSGKAQRMLF